MIKRDIESTIKYWLFKGKVIILYGPRRTGKTTVVKKILADFDSTQNYFDCENINIANIFSIKDPEKLRSALGNGKLFVLDEAQSIPNIGLSLKLLIDNYPDIQIIATGSSSFDLANKTGEPLTGRSIEFELLPFSINELKQVLKPHEIASRIETFLRYGMYPNVFNATNSDAEVFLYGLTNNYLFKDILSYEQIRKSDLLLKILKLLALQIGNEVSYTEIANKLQCKRETVIRYIDLLEKTFVITKIGSFSRNLRNEIDKKIKIYFIDLGIRNALIGQFGQLDTRLDLGFLWENFLVIERIKNDKNLLNYKNRYFWRTYTKQEIDYLEEKDGVLQGFEFKWKNQKYRPPRIFQETYGNSDVKLISKDNFLDFLDLDKSGV